MSPDPKLATIPPGNAAQPQPAGIYESQRPLYQLMLNSLAAIRKDYWDRRTAVPLAAASLVMGCLFGIVSVLSTASGVHATGGGDQEWVVYLVCLLPVLGSLGMLLSRKHGLVGAIDLLGAGRADQRLEFHRLDLALGIGFGIYIAAIGAFLGIHIQLLYQTADHCGLGYSPSWAAAFLMAATNCLDGLTLGLSHALGLTLGNQPTHTTQSSALFSLFRFAYGAHVVILAVAIWRPRVILHLMSDFDRYLATPTPERMRQYLDAVCHRAQNWAKHYHDEFVFFCLVERCLSRNYDDCRMLRSLFPEIGVPPVVWPLFRKGTGQEVFTKQPEASTPEE